MPKFDQMGNLCKFEEKTFGNNPYLMNQCPAIVRIDGRNFSGFTRGLRKPFDERLVDLMIDTTKFLVKETASVWGFCQSDEITLCFYSENRDSQIFFDGKTQKIVSVTASLATAYFNSQVGLRLPEKANKLATFDSRAFNVPTLSAAVRQYIWRENDATKNSLSTLCQAHFSHKELHGKRQADQHELLRTKSINWNDLPSKFKRGAVVRRTKRGSSYTAEEIEALPKNHEARKNPSLTFTRSVVESVDLPPLTKVSNKIGVLFYGENPILKSETEKV